MKRSKWRDDRVRELIAQEAAKIMHDEAVRDFQQAKQKACDRLGFSGKVSMPSNDEIQLALTLYISVFKQDSQPRLLGKLRRAALAAMKFLARFEPRLVGRVLDGTADQHSAVQLHVFADTTEQILQFLIDQGIPYELAARRLQYRGDRQLDVSLCTFLADNVPIELFLFSRLEMREAPRSPIDGKPMARANLAELEGLLELSDSTVL